MRLIAAVLLSAAAAAAQAAEFLSVGENAAVLYDAPSREAKSLYVVSRHYPLEVIVNLEAWVKVRDHAGALSWVERKLLTSQRMVVVVAPSAEARQRPEDGAAVAFTAAQNVALELLGAAPGGWLRVRHADGVDGYLRANLVWGGVKRIAVLGAGAWGTALAAVLSARHAVTLWARDAAQARTMARERSNRRYLPEIELPAQLAVSAAWPAQADLYIAATPVAGLREVAARTAGAPLLWLCKGFESDSGLLPHQVVAAARGARAPSGALSGPSFAQEVARGLPCALTLASRNAAFARDAAALLHGGRLRIYRSTDVVGVEIGGAVKNVMAIAVGIADGLGLGQNARAALITRGLAEISRLGTALGARPQTLMGLAGAGDLILTATGDLSRNRRVGRELARGRPLPAILQDLGHVAEGVHSARETLRLAARHGVDMPITQAVNAVLDGRLAPPQAVERLLSRDAKEEARVSPRRKSRAAARPRTPRRRRRSTG